MNAPFTLPLPAPLDKPEALAWWLPRHEAKLRAVRAARAAGQPIDLVLIGDSITHGWEDAGRRVWDEHLAPRKALGLGFWGDCTEHVLWRLQQGEVDGLSPRLVVLMIGTNNTGDRQDAPELTAAGIARLVRELRRRLPRSRLLLLAIFPRDADPASPLRQLNEGVNALIAPLADGEAVHFLDINAAFTQADGSLSPQVLPDQLHLSELGYRLWAQAMLPTLDRLLAAPPLQPSLSMPSLTYSSPFPADFVFGVAAAAAQIEGAAFTDGKGESIWDRFSRQPGKVHDGDTLDVACDHYHRFDEDFALMASLGVKHYRLSFAWPRIYPNGDGELNPAGLDFYHRLFASMKKHGITPWVTLFHWDLPQALEDRGGWTSRTTVDAFARYADTVVQAFAGEVKHWITMNEIRCFTQLAYGVGSKAPGRKEPLAVVNQTFHHALLCHGHGVRAVREFGGAGAQVGLTDNCDVCVPVTETPADIAAAKAWFLEKNAHVLGAMHAGHYPADCLARACDAAPKVEPGDFDLISLPTDHLGLNIYTATYVRAGKDGAAWEALPLPIHYPKADSPWLSLVPQSIYWATRFAHELYGHSSLYITENGCGYSDEPVVNGEVLDLHRRDFLRSHLREAHRAIGDGVPLHGYFLWSFIDNYEWEDGYQRRFGIVHCDYATQVRTPKLSALYYADVIRQHRIL